MESFYKILITYKYKKILELYLMAPAAKAKIKIVTGLTRFPTAEKPLESHGLTETYTCPNVKADYSFVKFF